MASQLIAFDIGESLIKIVVFSGGRLKKAVAAELSDKMVSRGEIISMDAMADFIRELCKKHSIPKGNACVILPTSLVFTRAVDVPPMTEAQLSYNLPFEFKDYLTEEKSRYYFDYSVQGVEHGEDGKAESLHLFACCTLKTTIESYREMFSRAGFKLYCAIPEECAFSALLYEHIQSTKAAGGDYCIADVGYTGIGMHIFSGWNEGTRRVIDLGLVDVVQAIADSRGVDEHMAREHMMSDYNGVMDDPACHEIYNRMAVEIMKAVNFYNYNNRDKTLERIYLCGGGVAVKQIKDAISQTTNLEVFDIAELLPDDGGRLESPWLYAKAIGCALQN